ELAEVDVAVVQFAPRLQDADDGPGQVDVVEAGGLAPGPHGHAPAARVGDAAGAAREGVAHGKGPGAWVLGGRGPDQQGRGRGAAAGACRTATPALRNEDSAATPATRRRLRGWEP